MHPFAATLDLLKRTIDLAPSFFPDERRRAMISEYEKLAVDPNARRETIEEAIISFGKEIYPHRKAFWHIHNKSGRDIETRAIHEAVTDPALKEKLGQFLKTAGTIADIGRGTKAFENFFLPEEKAALVSAKMAAHDRVVSEIQSLCTGPEKDVCETAIGSYKNEQDRIGKLIDALRALAERGDKWRPEILDKVRTFEAGWSGLEREVREEDVRGEIEFYQGAIDATEGV